jgi:dTMP kinase
LWVVSDRWSDSTFAYQGAALTLAGPPGPDGSSFDALPLLRKMEEPFDMVPDLTLLFDLDPEVALERVGRRGEDAEKFERLDFLVKVRANYLRLAKEEPARYIVLDAARPVEAVLADALRAVDGTASEQS